MNKKYTGYLSSKRGNGRKSKQLLAIIILVLVIVSSILFGGFLSDAHDNEKKVVKKEIYYKSVQIAHGDTLWSIASTYSDHTTETVEEYIVELKELNSLYNDDIHADRYLTVKCYDTMTKL